MHADTAICTSKENEVYNSRLHLTDSESSPDYAARIFSFANATLSMNVCIGVLP